MVHIPNNFASFLVGCVGPIKHPWHDLHQPLRGRGECGASSSGGEAEDGGTLRGSRRIGGTVRRGRVVTGRHGRMGRMGTKLHGGMVKLQG